MSEANRLIEEIEKQLIEVKYHLDRGDVKAAAIKSEYVKRPSVALYKLLNEKK